MGRRVKEKIAGEVFFEGHTTLSAKYSIIIKNPKKESLLQ